MPIQTLITRQDPVTRKKAALIAMVVTPILFQLRSENFHEVKESIPQGNSLIHKHNIEIEIRVESRIVDKIRWKYHLILGDKNGCLNFETCIYHLLDIWSCMECADTLHCTGKLVWFVRRKLTELTVELPTLTISAIRNLSTITINIDEVNYRTM